MLATLVVVGQAHLVPLALHGLAGVYLKQELDTRPVSRLCGDAPSFGVPGLLMLSTLVTVEYALRVPLALHGPALLYLKR